jgi:hypothetical protein
MMRWGMPPPPKFGGPPVTNIRNTSSPHWRGWLRPENRCLVPANSFSEYAPATSSWAPGLNQYIEWQRQFGAHVGGEADAREAEKHVTSAGWPRGQRAAPVVVPEGPAAGGGVWSSVVDPGIPLGPGLLATRVVFHVPAVRIATASMTTAITANVRKCMAALHVS